MNAALRGVETIARVPIIQFNGARDGIGTGGPVAGAATAAATAPVVVAAAAAAAAVVVVAVVVAVVVVHTLRVVPPGHPAPRG